MTVTRPPGSLSGPAALCMPGGRARDVSPGPSCWPAALQLMYKIESTATDRQTDRMQALLCPSPKQASALPSNSIFDRDRLTRTQVMAANSFCTSPCLSVSLLLFPSCATALLSSICVASLHLLKQTCMKGEHGELDAPGLAAVAGGSVQ